MAAVLDGPKLELMIYGIVALLMVACSWLLLAVTALPTWAAIVIGCVGAFLVAAMFNVAWALLAYFRSATAAQDEGELESAEDDAGIAD